MELIKESINKFFVTLEAKRKDLTKEDPQYVLKKILTKEELKHLKFNYFYNGVLGLNIDSSPWLYQMNLKKEEILSKLRDQSKQIKDIKFNLGEVK